MHVLYSFPDGIGRPGIGTTAFNQVRELAARVETVTLYCTSRHRELPKNVRVVETLSVAGRRVPHRVLGIDRSYRYHDRRVARAVRRLGRKIDIVHCWPRATIATCSAARNVGVPCVREVPNTHTAHAFDVVERERAALGLAPDRGHSHNFDERRLAREEHEYAVADALLVPSDYSLRTFLERGVAPSKLLLHRYGYDETRFFANGAQRDRPFTAIFVGRCEPRKGLHYALQAWHDSRAADTGRFVIVGAFDDDYRAKLAPLLSHPSVQMRGFVDDPGALMRDSDVFVFPSIEEGSALVTYEARACGCVLVVSEAAGARCRDGIDGLVHAPGDVATLTEHLRRLSRDRGLLERLRSAALEQSAEYTWSRAGEELVELYERVRR